MEKFYTKKEICDVLGFKPTKLWQLQQTDGFPAGKNLIPGKKVFSESEVQAWVDTRLNGTTKTK